MARFFVDEVDDELLYDGSQSFNGGMVSLVKPQLLDPNQCADLQNCDIDRSGRIQTRRGTAALGDLSGSVFRVRGLGYYQGTNSFLLRVANGALKSWDGSNWANIAGFTPGAGVEVDIAQVQTYAYFSDGTNVYRWNNTGNAVVVAAAPACTHLLSHTKRLFAIGVATSDEIKPSDLLDPTTWSYAAFRVGGDGEAITGASPWHNNLLAVLKRTSCWVIDADPQTGTATWTHTLVNSKVGCIAWRSVVQVGNDIFFLSDDGVRSIQRTINDNQIGVSLPLSDPIRPIIDRINWSSADQSCGCYVGNRYLLAVPLDSATSPNYVLVYNTFTNGWSGYWTGWNPTVFAQSKFSGTLKANFGQVNGKVLEFLGWKPEGSAGATDYTDAGTAIPTSLTTKAFSFGDAISDKSGFNYEAEFLNSSANATISILRDSDSAETSYTGPTSLAGNVLPLVLPFTLTAAGSYRVARDLASFDQFRSIQFKVASVSGKLAVQGVTASGFADTIEAERN